MKLNPALADGLERLGNLLLNTGGRDKAVQLFRRAAAVAPNWLAGRLNHAKVLMEEGGPKEAMESLRHTTALFPASWRPSDFWPWCCAIQASSTR